MKKRCANPEDVCAAIITAAEHRKGDGEMSENITVTINGRAVAAVPGASILDTYSCMMQGLLPYGAQMLMAAGLAQLNPISIMPYLYYPLAIGIAATLSILCRYPKRYS